MPLWESIILRQLVPSIFDAGLMLLLVLAAFKVFKVKNPATRFFFLFLPLVKPFIILLDRPSAIDFHDHADHTICFSLRMPDPLNLVNLPFLERSAISYNDSTLIALTLLAVAMVFTALIVRWLELFVFRLKLSREPELDYRQHPEVYEIFNGLLAKLKVKRPKLVLSDKHDIVPFSFGYKEPVIVLSDKLLASFPKEQLEIMLAHELAHIQRRDSRSGWISLVFRDILFFNPFTHLAYLLVEEEKEHACDRIALEVTKAKPSVVAHALVDVALFYRDMQASKSVFCPGSTKGLLYRESFLTRRIRILGNPPSIKKPSTARKILGYVLFFILLYVQFGFNLHFGNQTIMLR